MKNILVEQLRIKEFRGIRECKETIKLNKINILIGRNNSGKSTILEALSLIPTPTTPIPVLDKYRRRIVAEIHGGPRSLVYGYDGKATIEYYLGRNVLAYHIDTHGNFKTSINEEAPAGKLEDVIAEIMNVEEEEFDSTALFIPNDTRFLRELEKRIVEEKYWNRVVKCGANVSIISDVVSKVVDDVYTEAFVSYGDLRLRKQLDGQRVIYVKIEDLGDGIERMLTSALWLETYRPKLVLWDDFEASAHPSLIRVMLEWLTSREWQVVLATHSIDVLAEIIELKPKNTNIILLRKTRNDELHHKTLSISEVENLMLSSQDPRKIVDLLEL